MNANEVYGGNFITAMSLKTENLLGKPLTITDVSLSKVGSSEKERLILSFSEISSLLVLNRTNASIIIEVFGAETEKWIEKQITLQLTKRPFQGQMVDAILVVPLKR